MDLGFFGITDIVIILLFIIAIVIGAKKGFLTKFISLASGLVALIIAIIFCSRFADFLIGNNVFYPGIKENIITNINNASGLDANAGATQILEALGFPGIIANYIGAKFPDSFQVDMLAAETARLFMVIISFVILLVGCWILTFVIKIIIKMIRSSIIVRVIDGILGVILYGFLAIVAIYVLLFVLSLVIQIPALTPFRDFMTVDMQLNTDEFRLSKYFYENNILINFFRLFF